MNTTLSNAIRTALTSTEKAPPSELSAEELAADGRMALNCIEAVMTAASEICAPANNEREFVTLQLCRASSDHARALTYLIANNPLDLTGSALALHRSQIEQYLRAIFVGEIASEEELEDFLTEDEGPRRKSAKGRWSKIGTVALAAEVQEKMQELEGERWTSPKLANMVASAWNPLCGMVHGGRSVRVMYADRNRTIGCTVPWRVCLQTTVNAVAINNFCLAQTVRMSGIGLHEAHEKLGPPVQAFERYLEERRTHLTGLGIRLNGNYVV